MKLPSRLGDIDLVWSNLDMAHEADPLFVLSPVELERARRFLTERDRHRYEARRIALRVELGRRLSCVPSAVDLRFEGRGRPFIAASSIRCSASHSGSMAVFAFGSQPVGIDIEQSYPGVFDPDVCAVAFTQQERLWIQRAPDLDEAFLRCWTRKEALFKALGGSIDLWATKTVTPSLECEGVVVTDADLGGRLVLSIAVCHAFEGPGLTTR